MSEFQRLYEFTDIGMDSFQRVMKDLMQENEIQFHDSSVIRPLPNTASFKVSDFSTSKEMADAIIAACGNVNIQELLRMNGLWAWLTFVLRNQVFPRDAQGKRKTGEIHRWYPSNLNDWRKSQRHLVRMPVLLLHRLKDDADHLLSGPPKVHGEIREQLTSQQDMFHETFQSVAKRLYFNEETGALKRGAGTSGPGSPRRLAYVRKQLDVTWDLFTISPQRLFDMLPKEFDRFK